MGGGFLYFFIVFGIFILVAGVVTLLVTIFYLGDWIENRKKLRSLEPPAPPEELK